MGLSKLLFGVARRKIGAERLSRMAAHVRRQDLSRELGARVNYTVTDGLFKGMILASETASGDGDISPKLLGTYEADLHGVLEKAVSRAPSLVINVGCAEGYYAIGLARLLPAAVIHAFDLNESACAICRHAARQNDVNSRIHMHGKCTPELLGKMLSAHSGHPLILMDCEGDEHQLLDPDYVQRLNRADIIVETHRFAHPEIVETLKARLSTSHEIDRIQQGGRDPNACEQATRFSELDRWLMVNEGRGEVMTWLACWARGAAGATLCKSSGLALDEPACAQNTGQPHPRSL